MSDEALRTRIADIIERVGNDWDAQMMSSIVDGKPQPQQPLAETAAQAIIDELGLTMEMRVSSVGRTVDRRTGIVTNSTQTRIVGKWEQQ